jgi:nitrite reductase/ring-hydroxylating ferredoxin subunit
MTDPCDALIDELLRDLPAGRVPATVFGDDRLYQRELRRVFGRCWLFLAHSSEVPRPGDFVRRRMGEDSFIVVRGRSGRVNVLFDACRHRGVRVCRADQGSTRQFRCPYHGWTYDTDGRLTGAPAWRQALGGLAKQDNGLLRPAQTGQVHGLIFATLDPAAPPLADYLGGASWYLDLLFGLDPGGIEVLAPPQRFVIDANWKSPAENFCGDDYHLATLHRSVWEIGAFPVPFTDDMEGYHIQAAPGHSVSVSMAEQDDGAPFFFGLPAEVIAGFRGASLTAAQREVARRSRVLVGNIFPNFSVLAQPASPDGGRTPSTGVMTFRVWQPLGPGRIEACTWFFGYKSMTAQQRARSYAAGLATVSLAGSFEMDDAEPWASTATTARSVAAELLGLRFNYQMGLGGVGSARPAPHWPGPGLAVTPRLEEGVQRNFLEFYARLMKAPPGTWPAGHGGPAPAAAAVLAGPAGTRAAAAVS